MFFPNNSCDRRQRGHPISPEDELLHWAVLSCDASHGHGRYLGLVADRAHAAVVYEREHALTVVARNELCWHTYVVDVRVTGATSHLKEERADFGML